MEKIIWAKYSEILNIKLVQLLFIIIAISSINCTSTIVKRKDPVLSSGLNAVSSGLKGIIVSEHINLYGKELFTNGKSKSVFEIEIKNGQNIQEDEKGIEALGRTIASFLKKSLKDPNEYDSYEVIFSKKTAEGVATRTHWKSMYFDSKDL